MSGNNVDYTLMKDIVSGPLDADKIDYLSRDSYYCGVKYGVFDFDRLLNTFSINEDSNDRSIAIKEDGLNALEQFVLAKYYMITQVYSHKVRTMTDAMIIRGIETGIDSDELEFLKVLYFYDKTEKYLDNYLNYWDDRLNVEILSVSKKSFAKEIFQRLYRRNLFKRIFSKNIPDIPGIKEKIRDKLGDINSNENSQLKMNLEEEISNLNQINCEKEFVIVNSVKLKSIWDLFSGQEGNIVVDYQNSQKKPFEQSSTIFVSMQHEITQNIKFEVYAPLKEMTIRDKYKIISEIEKSIIDLLSGLE